MRRLKILLTLFLSIPIVGLAQTDHWESVILEGDEWAYVVPDSQPDPNWITMDYDDSEWLIGNSGFGYGDGDDNTILANGIPSVYIRKAFNIVDLTAIDQALLHLDYDDGFVAYLNGAELTRSLVSETTPGYDQYADGLHEANLYQGQVPASFAIDPSLLVQGDNILAVEVHNESSTSSDLTAIPILSLGINTTDQNYRPTPSWFQAPLIFTESNLPIVVIDTDNQTIVDEPKIAATIGTINNGDSETNKLSDPFEYYGDIGIELRGESSLYFDKKSYAIEMWDDEGNDMDTSLLGFPNEEDFILYGPYADKSLINNRLIMKLANEMGHYASRTKFVELLINGEYLGIYVLMERIKRDKNRIDISKLDDDEINGDDLTGGYIFRIDKGNNDGWSSQYNAYNGNYTIFFQYFYPKPEDIVPEQKGYIKQYVDDFEEAIASTTHFNQKGKHYTEYIDLRSFVDNFIINELSKNVDAYRLSSYFYKDKDSKDRKIKCGYWDFNLSFGNADYCSGDDPTGWIYYQCSGNSPFWWHNMLQDTLFTNATKCRWEELRQTILSNQAISDDIDVFTNEIGEAQVRNYQRWPVLGTYLWPNPWFYEQPTTYSGIIEALKGWTNDRLAWLDSNMPGTAQNCELYEDFDTIEQEEITLGLDKHQPQLNIFPNPASTVLNIESISPMVEIIISNTSGQILFQSKPNTKVANIELREGYEGVLFISVKTKTELYRKKVLLIK